MRARRLRNEHRLKKDKVESLLSKDYAWQMEKRKQEQIKVLSYDLVQFMFLCLFDFLVFFFLVCLYVSIFTEVMLHMAIFNSKCFRHRKCMASFIPKTH